MPQKPDTGATLKDLETAFRDLVRVWQAGGRAGIAGSEVQIEGARETPEAADRLRRNPESARTVLVGRRKPWADDLKEAIIDAEIRHGDVVRVGLVRLDARRVILGAEAIDVSNTAGIERLKQVMGGVNGVVLRDLPYRARAAVGLLLTRCAPDHRIPVVEVAIPDESDYGQFLAGSFWIDLNLKLGRDDILGHALLRALQVRSIRATALKAHKLGYYSVIAVKRLHADGVAVSDIVARTGLPERLVVDWTGAQSTMPHKTPTERHHAASGNPQTPEGTGGATGRQRAKAGHLMDQLPFLRRVFRDGWDSDRRTASSAIARGCEIQARHGARVDGLVREQRARQALARGAPKAQAAREAGLSLDALDRGLDQDLDGRLDALVQELSKEIGEEIPRAEVCS